MAINKSITIGSTEVKPGDWANIRLPVADLYNSSGLHMTTRVVCGRRPGPTLFISAAVHGDELNGVEVIRRLLNMRALRTLRGTLLAVPIVNVHGFLDQSRYLPDRRDLNRCFPGTPKGSIASRLAHTFYTQVVKKADYGIDLHTGAINRSNLPQIRANLDDERTMDLAKAFGAPVIINANIRDGSLRACAAEMGLPMLIYEAGEALRFDEMCIRAGVRGILGVMRQIGMLPARRRKQSVVPVLARTTRWVRAPSSGIVNNKVKLGSRVNEDQCLATISDPVGEAEEAVYAGFDGIVIGLSKLPLAHEGDALFNIAAFRSVARAENMVEEFADVVTDGMDADDFGT